MKTDQWPTLQGPKSATSCFSDKKPLCDDARAQLTRPGCTIFHSVAGPFSCLSQTWKITRQLLADLVHLPGQTCRNLCLHLQLLTGPSYAQIWAEGTLEPSWQDTRISKHPFPSYPPVRACSVASDSSRPQGLKPDRRLWPWDSPSKNSLLPSTHRRRA